MPVCSIVAAICLPPRSARTNCATASASSSSIIITSNLDPPKRNRTALLRLFSGCRTVVRSAVLSVPDSVRRSNRRSCRSTTKSLAKVLCLCLLFDGESSSRCGPRKYLELVHSRNCFGNKTQSNQRAGEVEGVSVVRFRPRPPLIILRTSTEVHQSPKSPKQINCLGLFSFQSCDLAGF